MAVIDFNESNASRSLSVKVGDGFAYTRSFTVQIDDPRTPLLEIINAPGVRLWAAHPEDVFSRAQSFDVKPRGSSLMLYEVTVNYSKVEQKDEQRQEQKPGEVPDATNPLALPKTQWSGGTSNTLMPFDKDVDGKAVANSAGVPFAEAEKKVFVPTLQCVKCYPTYNAMRAAVKAIVGKVNDAAWGDGAIGEWLCDSSRWSWKSEAQGNQSLKYVECTFEFAWQEGGWAQKYLDVGYMQKVDASGNASASGTKLGPILGQDKKPVKEPVGLNGSGIAMDPPPSPTNPPLVANGGKGFMPYKSAAFATTVGSPT